MKLNSIDICVVAFYLLFIVGLGIFAGMRQRRAKHADSGYFLAGNSLKWPEIGLALFATNISCFHLVSLAQAGYDNGLVMGNFEWMAGFTLVLLSLVFVPFYIRSKVATLPDFLERRYNRQCRDWLAVISMLAAIIMHIAFPLVTGYAVLHAILGIDKWVCIFLMCGLTAVYTVIGGLAAVVATEMVQAIVLLIGAALITWFSWQHVGGWDGMVATLNAKGEAGRLLLLRSARESDSLPWYSILLGYPIIGVWYWCADQTIVQRVLGAKDENHARTGPLFCAVIKVLPLFIFVLPGLFFFAILQQGKLPGVAVTDSKEVYGLMIQNLLPHGLLGVMAAALMAALMGNLASAANSTATLFSYDIWKRFRPETPEKKLVLIGRLASLTSFALGIALIPLLDLYESFFAGINDIICHMAPPITCVFLMGILWPAASARSAKWTMWLGSALGAVMFAIKTLHSGQKAIALLIEKVVSWIPDSISWLAKSIDWIPTAISRTPEFFYKTPFMLMAFYMFVACVLLQITLTFIWPKQSSEDPQALHWKNPLDCVRTPGWPLLGDYRVLAGLVTLAFVALYLFFPSGGAWIGKLIAQFR